MRPREKHRRTALGERARHPHAGRAGAGCQAGAQCGWGRLSLGEMGGRGRGAGSHVGPAGRGRDCRLSPRGVEALGSFPAAVRRNLTWVFQKPCSMLCCKWTGGAGGEAEAVE